MSACSAMQLRMFDPEGGVRAPPDACLLAHLQGCRECAALFRGLGLVESAFSDAAAGAVPEPPPFEPLRARAASAAFARRTQSALRKLIPSVVLVVGSAVVAMLVAGPLMRSERPRPIHAGDVLEADRQSRHAVLSSGTRVVLESGRLLISGDARRERLRLESGAVSLRVPPLPKGSKLSVETADGKVCAHGTRFRVERSAEGTRVALSEGMVRIHPSGPGREVITLHPGESALIEPLPAYRQRLRSSALASLGQGAPDGAAAALDKLLATQPEGALAGEAHAMMGLVHQARGETAAAAEEYRRSLDLAPRAGGALWADNAAAELALLEEARSPDAGAVAWRKYLASFPAGAHKALATSHLAHARGR
jgi:hypothetical protein